MQVTILISEHKPQSSGLSMAAAFSLWERRLDIMQKADSPLSEREKYLDYAGGEPWNEKIKLMKNRNRRRCIQAPVFV